jgi:hypothetical protein
VINPLHTIQAASLGAAADKAASASPGAESRLGVGKAGPVTARRRTASTARSCYLNQRLRLTESEIVSLSPMRLPLVDKLLALTYGTTELRPLISDSRELHALRSAAHLPGALIPVPAANHFTITNELRDLDGILTRHLPLLLPGR